MSESDDGITRRFPFPTKPSRRERMLFEEHAGISFGEFGVTIADDVRKMSARSEAALIFVAAKRVKPDVTFDEVVEHDDWGLEAPEVADDGPLPPPTTPSE